MLSVGQMLQAERERQGLSIEDVADRTKISLKNLRAIESDDSAAVLTAFFYKSFVRQFASTLAIDYSTLEESVNLLASSIPAPRIPGQDYHAVDVPPIRPRRTRWWSNALPVVALIGVLAACSGLYSMVDRLEIPDASTIKQFASRISERATLPGKPAPQVIASSRDLIAKEPATSSVNQIPPASAQPSTSVTKAQVDAQIPVASEAVSLKIAAVEQAWLSVDADGHHIYSGVLEASDTKVLEGRETARIRTGNAGGLTVTFNGKDLGTLGQRGQVRTVLFTKDQYEILQPDLSSRLELLPVSFTE
jgi:cytoskeleton protein RodZ